MFPTVRHASVVVASVAALAMPGASLARGVAVRVIIVAPVSAPATDVMPPDLWRRLIARYVGGTAVPLAASPTPTVSDCRAAGADLLVTAPFALAPKLPGLPGSSDGRVAATTHVVAISCATGAVVLDRVVPLESDPPSDEEAGDFERDPELVWDRGVAVALARGRIDNALVRRQATIALAASVADAGHTDAPAAAATTPRGRRPQGAQIAVYAATPTPVASTAPIASSTGSPIAEPASAPPDATVARVARAATTRHATPLQAMQTAAVAPSIASSAAPIARLVDLIDVSRIAGVKQPFAILNVRDPSLQAGDRLVDFADASHVLRAKPIELTVTENFGTYVQIVFDATGDAPVPAKGDLVQRAPATP